VTTGFLDRTTRAGATTYRYVVYVPFDWTPPRVWPVILFLHGIGERGTDGLRQSEVGLGRAIRLNAERVPAIVVFPQLQPEQRWLGEPAEAAMRALDEAIAEFNGDPQRLYLTGLSLGGFGVWHLAQLHPQRFAALVPVCGGIAPALTAAAVARVVRHIPTWIFHGADDDIIPVAESRNMHNAMPGARYTEYPACGHDSWTRAYAEPELWTWLFAQRRQRN
jgi:predicted peptidase